MSDSVDVVAAAELVEAATAILTRRRAAGRVSPATLIAIVAATRVIAEDLSELLIRIATERVRAGALRVAPAELLVDALEEATDLVRSQCSAWRGV